MISVAFEHIRYPTRSEIFEWLEDTVGPTSTSTWYVDPQPLIEDLVMNKETYTLFILKFANALS